MDSLMEVIRVSHNKITMSRQDMTSGELSPPGSREAITSMVVHGVGEES